MQESDESKLAFSKTEATDISLLPSRLQRRPHLIEVIQGPGAPRTLPISHSVTVGRANEADLRIMSADLSRMHVRIDRVRHGYRVVDLGSINGVFLNEVRVHSADLRDGDTIQLGNVVLLYHEGS